MKQLSPTYSALNPLTLSTAMHSTCCVKYNHTPLQVCTWKEGPRSNLRSRIGRKHLLTLQVSSKCWVEKTMNSSTQWKPWFVLVLLSTSVTKKPAAIATKLLSLLVHCWKEVDLLDMFWSFYLYIWKKSILATPPFLFFFNPNHVVLS